MNKRRAPPVSRNDTFLTPPKRRRLSREISDVANAGSKNQRHEFEPLSKPFGSPSTASKRKRPRIGQTTPTKSKTIQKPSTPAIYDHEPGGFDDADDDACNDFNNDVDNHFEMSSQKLTDYECLPPKSTIDQDNHDFDLDSAIYQIEMRQKNLLPEYLELLQWRPMSLVRLSDRCFIVQDWDSRKKALKVILC